ncbi:YigZ family protein [Mechercharimyces sp. CAU 1602]|uniref:YigZ family protein n=1 Tax=Mechercharimyces sp. CAU 1602 TaxID=2973933 RepID=UPI002161A17C|nr:YigZ family protein [Mechercharimyces sp. CAU 1602]MCS1352242.1 YigZ family protein [Mechercharimyces sp. CAU 1602]
MKSAQSYWTVSGYAETELIIQKSRFIGYATRVETEGEAQLFIEKIRKNHWSASHNCFAYYLTKEGGGPEAQKASDDGEPAGTAGKPILETIHAHHLWDTVIVVTRYFGGVKLGSGGLVRAYGQTASAVIQTAGISHFTLQQCLTITVSYEQMGKIEYDLHRSPFEVSAPAFAAAVTWNVWIPCGKERPLLDQLSQHTNGQAHITWGEIKYRPSHSPSTD